MAYLVGDVAKVSWSLNVRDELEVGSKNGLFGSDSLIQNLPLSLCPPLISVIPYPHQPKPSSLTFLQGMQKAGLAMRISLLMQT